MDLPLATLDWIALAVFALCWAGYAMVVDRVPSIRARSVIAAMDEHRRRWMRAAPGRENRIADISIIGNLMTSTSFLANTSIFILGGLVAMLGAPDLGRRIFGAVPFVQAPVDDAGWEIRIFLLIFIFVRAFFELTWALRQFNYCSICVGALGKPPEALADAEVAAEVANRAARHFNTGLRAYYFGLAALAWILHPLALIVSSLLVLRELHRREFRSVVRDALNQAPAGSP
ncbi:DUF599 domain-containing protein [Roseomonas sp. M0104]|uniref:DUF599 domain-containing protein n=1 Tax=Teichococcus coralli TaxID=2545983 RepID=A0A845BE49_9PROT|nr:DUF599 domain-containing protein [Pseudoroseomonas coralli]MXP65853.1 DUF599 domain-containing protein [Pseudoroseomonas coralli]